MVIGNNVFMDFQCVKIFAMLVSCISRFFKTKIKVVKFMAEEIQYLWGFPYHIYLMFYRRKISIEMLADINHFEKRIQLARILIHTLLQRYTVL